MNFTQRRPWGPRKLGSARLSGTRLNLTPLAVESGLRFSEVLLIFVLAVATLITASNPIFGVPLHHSFLNHFALLIFAPVLVLHAFGQVLNRSTPPFSAIFGVCWPLIFLALYSLVGSAIAKWDFGLDDTYLALGIYLLIAPACAACMPVSTARLRPWAIGLLLVWTMFSVASLAGQGARVTVGNLHEIEFLVASGFIAMYYATRSISIKLLAVVMMAAAAVLNAKLTGYIILALAILHIMVTSGWRYMPRNLRGLYGGAALLFAVAVSAVLTLLYFEYRDFLPSGNPEVRLAQYETAWRQFLGSPVWGNAFLSGSGEIVSGSFGRAFIPTHSDVLDILKHGGVIGFVLFAWGYWKLFAMVNSAVKATTNDTVVNAYLTSVRFFLVTALVTFMLNPLLLKGPYAFMIWANLGFGVGAALTILRKPAESPAA